MSGVLPPRPAVGAPRTIRSFVRRGGRITPAQQRALAKLWPAYGLDFDGQPFELGRVFGRHALQTLEIGFGDGESLVALAAARPERDFIGIEVHTPGIGHCLLAAEAADLKNLRIVKHDAVEVLGHGIAPGALDEVLIYFPDPWPKKRHHKRRLLQPAFVELLATRLAPDARLRLATDWEPYAEQMLEVLGASRAFASEARDGRYVARPAERPLTKFERRGTRLGHVVRDLEFRRRG